MLCIAATLTAVLGAPSLELDRPAAPSQQINVVHVLIGGLDGEAVVAVDFEAADVVRSVEVINAPSMRRGPLVRVLGRDLPLTGGEPLLVRLTVTYASVGRFRLGTARVRISNAGGGERLFVEEVAIDVLDDAAYAARERRPEVVATVQRIVAGPRNFVRPPSDPDVQARLRHCLDEVPFTLVLDPGHDAEASRGAHGHSGVDEVVRNDRFVALLMRRLGAVPGLSVLRSRAPEESLPLPERVRHIRSLSPSLMLSIHHDAVQPEIESTIERPAGAAVVYTCGDREGFSIYAPMSGSHAILSYQAARYIGAAFAEAGRPIGRFFEWGEPDLGIYNSELLYLLDNLAVPSLLVEVAFVCNPDEERLLDDQRSLDRMVTAVADGILRYITFAHCGGLRLTSPWIPASGARASGPAAP